MTERWRKKLGDLDKQGPNEDVFERAKDGPMHLDDPLPGMKTSTRIATAVAAFAVFALAISVFAIPALRMQGTQAGSATSGLFPLWPSQTPDQLKQLQADADVGNAAWALDPKLVAERFAHDVMGWSDATVGQELSSSCAVAYGGQSSSPGYAPGDVPSSDPGTCVPSQADVQRCGHRSLRVQSAVPCDGRSFFTAVPAVSGAVECYAGCLPGYTPPSSLEAWLGTGSAAPPAGNSSGGNGAFLTFLALPCGGGLNQCIEFGAERIIVFQPLQQGDGQIWAVMEARSDSITLSTAATQNVRSGASIGATSQYQRGITTLGYASCGATGGSSDGKNMAAGFSIMLDTSLPASANCSGQQPGYAWGAQATASLADGNDGITIDPLRGGAQAVLLGLTAVPIVMTFPDAEVPSTTEQAGPPSLSPTGAPPGDTVTSWTSYNDPSGMTMDVPDTWSTHSIDSSTITGFGGTGAEFSGTGLTVDVFQSEYVSLPADDSSYPLAYDSLLTRQSDGALTGGFRGDGQAFRNRVTSSDAQLTSAQEAILQRMVESIHFDQWSPGETRNGWTSAGPIDAAADGQWVSYGDSHVFARFKDGQRSVLGPFPPCSTGEGTYGTDTVVAGRTVISIHCPDGDVGQWDFSGGPLPGNPNYFGASIKASGAILSWDGQLLVQLEVPGSTPSP